MRLVLPFLLFVFMLFGCSSKQSGLYSKKGIVKCADHVEHKDAGLNISKPGDEFLVEETMRRFFKSDLM